jgi:hypothetical protein
MPNRVPSAFRAAAEAGVGLLAACNRLRLPGTRNPFVVGVHEPMREELTLENLPVTGAIPPGFDGLYLKMGANPVRPTTRGHDWFLGDGLAATGVDHLPDRCQRAGRGRDGAQVVHLNLQGGVALPERQGGMDRVGHDGLEQRRERTAMDGRRWIVEVLARLHPHHHGARVRGDKVDAEQRDYRRRDFSGDDRA